MKSREGKTGAVLKLRYPSDVVVTWQQDKSSKEGSEVKEGNFWHQGK